jgi:hypothetical protein
VLQNFYYLGPTARLCLQYGVADVDTYLKQRETTIQSIQPITGKEIFSKLLNNASNLSLDIVSHKICLIRRIKRRNWDSTSAIVCPISEPVAKALASQFEKFDQDELLDMWRRFSRLPDARGMSGSIFEAYVQQQFRRQINFDAEPMRRGTRSNSRWYASFSQWAPKSATSSVQSIPRIIINAPETVVYQEGKLKVETDTYYIPRSGQQVALDSFIVHEGFLYIYSCAAGSTHGIKDEVVAFLQECEGVPSEDCWRFIFVVPDDLPSFSCPASSNEVIGRLNPYTCRISMSP